MQNQGDQDKNAIFKMLIPIEQEVKIETKD